jgi:DNA-binding response OmpR family regulator
MPTEDIIIVEDETLIALDIELTLHEAGHDAVRIFSNAEDPRRYLADCRPRLGLLDINLGNGETSIAVARALGEAGVPFLFLTGETEVQRDVPEDLADRPRLDKPFSDEDLLRAVAPLLAAG